MKLDCFCLSQATLNRFDLPRVRCVLKLFPFLFCGPHVWFSTMKATSPKRLMCRFLLLSNFFLVMFGLTPPVAGTIQLVHWYRFGENDPLATKGAVANLTTMDSVGNNHLSRYGFPTYSPDVAPRAFAKTGSTFSMDFHGATDAFATTTHPSIPADFDNFGVELWVKVRTFSGGIQNFLYDGSIGFDGYGIWVENGKYTAFIGAYGGVGQRVCNTNVWTHLALVRESGTTTFYVDGESVGSTTATYRTTTTGMSIGNSTTFNTPFDGVVDEVRFFTFNPGEFRTTDLLGAPRVFELSTPFISVSETNGLATVTVRCTGSVAGNVSVQYSTQSGSATAGQDFTSTNGILTWADGEVGDKTILIPILNDTIKEKPETFSFQLSNPTGTAVLGSTSLATIEIIDPTRMPELTSITRNTDGIIRMIFKGVPQSNYGIQASPDLATWELIASVLTDANGFFTYDDLTGSNLAARFYRVIEQ